MVACLALRHVPFEDVGLLAALFAERGWDLRYLDVGTDAIDEFAIMDADLVVALGGPISVNDVGQYPFLEAEIRALRARLAADRPTLGVCLGAQLIARALDAEVSKAPAREIGWAPIALTDAGRDSVLAPLTDVPVLHWHGENVALPDGAKRLAHTDVCPNQAFALGSRILGLQFHLEVDPDRLEPWLVGHTVELGVAGIDPVTIREQAIRFGPATVKSGRRVLSTWLDGAGIDARPPDHGRAVDASD
ncbi:glutamine amidotransferase [Bauldia sp.]|uniref:glutamine amidotransferase n=1 Tax=Bauldia sp. TaxID=2575872 RepID=UPI003BAB774B